jgi:sister chromatid cohesion protein PDS5
LQSICAGLPQADPELLVAHIIVLAQIAKFAPDAFEHNSDVIMAFLVKQVLMEPITPDSVCFDPFPLILN